MNDDFSVNFAFNNNSSFTLPIPLDLRGYEVSVVNIKFPEAYYNVIASQIEYRSSSDKKIVTIPAGFYANSQTLIAEINRQLDTEKIELLFNDVKQTVTVKINTPRASVKLSRFLADALRLPYYTLKTNTESSRPVDISNGETLVVISNIVKPSLLNNSYSSILYVGAKNSKITNRLYIKTKDDIFQFLNIDVVDINMRPVTFVSGKTTITLHFRKLHK